MSVGTLVWICVVVCGLGLLARIFGAVCENKNMRECPHCMSLIPKPAHICAFCRQEVFPIVGIEKTPDNEDLWAWARFTPGGKRVIFYLGTGVAILAVIIFTHLICTTHPKFSGCADYEVYREREKEERRRNFEVYAEKEAAAGRPLPLYQLRENRYK
jgi:hypothetical protein